MSDTIEIPPATTLTVRSRSAEMLEMEAAYAPGGTPPPPHHHPAQDEHFEVLEGSMTGAGSAGTSERSGRARRSTSRAGRSTRCGTRARSPRGSSGRRHRPAAPRSGFATLADLLGRAAAGGDGAPGPEAFGELLASYEDVIRLEA